MKNNQFEKDIQGIPFEFNTLKIVEENYEYFLKGSLEIKDSTGKIWDTYHVEIKGSKNYPFTFPLLYETSNLFPKNPDWHVNSDNTCCIDVTPAELLICKNGLEVNEYIKRFAIPYLANQSFRIREGYYLHGEYAHGFLGHLEYYQKKLNPQNLLQLLQMFDLILRDFNPDRTTLCPFCKQTKFRKCHRPAFQELQAIKKQIADDRQKLIEILNNNPLLRPYMFDN